MKKIVALIGLMLICFFLFAANTYLDNLSKGSQIYGYIDQYCIVYVTAIKAQSGDSTGFPFSIEGADISHKPSDLRLGRHIANWSFATNMPSVKLTFNATPLASEDDPSYLLNYYLTFRYEYADSSSNSVMDYITIHSGTPSDITLTNYSGEDEYPIISMGNDIRFQLDGAYDFSDYPVGFYYANITITLEGI